MAGVRVKNTFIDVDDETVPPPSADLRRAQSEMVPRTAPEDDEDDSGAGTAGSQPAAPSAGGSSTGGGYSSGYAPAAGSALAPAAGAAPGAALAPAAGAGFSGTTFLTVKNTFFNYEEQPPPLPPGGLQRASTHTGVPEREQDDDAPDGGPQWAPMEPPQEAVTSPTGTEEQEDAFDPDADLEGLPPPPPDGLERAVTEENWVTYERGDQWWLGQPQQQQQQQQQLLLQQQQQQMLMQQQQGGSYVMVPVVMAPGQALPVVAPGVPQGPALPLVPPSKPAPDMVRVITPGDPPPGTPTPTSEDVPPLPVVEAAPPPPTMLVRAASVTQPNVLRIIWRIDNRKLKSTDREHVSPVFLVDLQGNRQFKLVMRPTMMHDGRGGGSFKKAKGKAAIELRCLDKLTSDCPKLCWRVSANREQSWDNVQWRGPVEHDFSTRSISTQKDAEGEFDFQAYTNNTHQCFFVIVEMHHGVGSGQAAASAAAAASSSAVASSAAAAEAPGK